MLQVKSELPSTFNTYRNQQHRWSCGPANLFRKMFLEILRNKVLLIDLFAFLIIHVYIINIQFGARMQNLCPWTKLYIVYNFFFIRKIVAHTATFVFYCVVLPATVLVPQVEIPRWGVIYIPSVVTLLNAVGTPRYLLITTLIN